jgi:hypothetical protein
MSTKRTCEVGGVTYESRSDKGVVCEGCVAYTKGDLNRPLCHALEACHNIVWVKQRVKAPAVNTAEPWPVGEQVAEPAPVFLLPDGAGLPTADNIGIPVGTIEPIGRKDDGGKVNLSLLPFESLIEIGKVLDFGAKKYAAHNWRGGMKWSRLLSAMLRHTFAFIRGEDKDPETGLSHMAHAGCCVLFLLSYVLTANGEDDRFKGNQ